MGIEREDKTPGAESEIPSWKQRWNNHEQPTTTLDLGSWNFVASDFAVFQSDNNRRTGRFEKSSSLSVLFFQTVPEIIL